jgi:putative redox protein
METAKIKYLGDLRTEALHLKSGKTLLTDAPTDNQGKGEAFSPTDILSASLASCMITIMGIKANEKKIDLTGINATVEKFMESSPRRVAKVKISINFPSGLNLDQKTRQILENAAINCPVAKSLHPEISQDVVFIY